ncbi:MAG TPA: hypothetical protein ENK18_08780 [Deltaproteobacteria bacterium]|nr:hypothetical protein [Deltaproteobacteria bacterium]
MSPLVWIGLAWAKDPCATEDSAEQNSDHIQALYDASNSDDKRALRASRDAATLAHDEKIAKEMAKLDRKGWLCTTEDRWSAAWLMQQSDSVEVLQRAYELAVETMEAQDPRGAWLVAFTFDHKRTAGGYRQSYGTRTRIDEMGRRCLVELEGDTTDAQRAAYGIEPLSAIYRQVLDLNGFTDDEPTEQRMMRHSLICPPLAFDKRAQRRVAPPTE